MARADFFVGKPSVLSSFLERGEDMPFVASGWVCALAILGVACLDTTFHTPPSPNFIVVLTDDQDASLLEAMPKLVDALDRGGVVFTNAFVTSPLCCPSRASLLRGQYAHNHGVWTNTPPDGGFPRFKEMGLEESTVATWLHGVGYRTGLIGKYLNHYAEEHIPTGWDVWYGKFQDGEYYGYVLNENGQPHAYGFGQASYEADVLTTLSVEFIVDAARRPSPFFLLVAPYAPHDPAVPAPRHEGAEVSASLPRPPSFNELDISDKPRQMQTLPLLTPNEVAATVTLRIQRARSLLAVDDMIEQLLQALDLTGQRAHTYVIVMSDNGYHIGEHRLPAGKSRPFEEDLRVPLVVIGPGMSGRTQREHLVLNIDLAPTIAELAGARTPTFVDGQSFSGLLNGSPIVPPAEFRAAFLFELRSFQGVRTLTAKYVMHGNGEQEWYDLRSDPNELENLLHAGDRELPTSLSELLERLRDCAGDACRISD